MNPNHFPQPSCELCGLTFQNRDELQHHMRQHSSTDAEQKVLDCTNCRKTFLTFKDMDLHNRRVHTPY